MLLIHRHETARLNTGLNAAVERHIVSRRTLIAERLIAVRVMLLARIIDPFGVFVGHIAWLQENYISRHLPRLAWQRSIDLVVFPVII